MTPSTLTAHRCSCAGGAKGLAIYRAQFRMLQEDGIVTEKERRSLEALRRRLGITKANAAAVEKAATSRGGHARAAGMAA